MTDKEISLPHLECPISLVNHHLQELQMESTNLFYLLDSSKNPGYHKVPHIITITATATTQLENKIN